MKTSVYILIIFLLASLVSCAQKLKPSGNQLQIIDSLKMSADLKLIRHRTEVNLIACSIGSKTDGSPRQIIDNLKEWVDQKWIRKNPVLITTKPSFFNKDNESKYFVGLLQISRYSVPLTWDDNLRLLEFVLKSNDEIIIKQGAEADSVYEGTKYPGTWI